MADTKELDTTLWLEDARDFLDEEYTQHFWERAKKSDNVEYVKSLLKKAKVIYSGMISEADKLLNKATND